MAKSIGVQLTIEVGRKGQIIFIMLFLKKTFFLSSIMFRQRMFCRAKKISSENLEPGLEQLKLCDNDDQVFLDGM